MATDYAEKLKDPRWQKKRLEILQRDEWTCQRCFDSTSTLVVHHRRYIFGREPWDYPNESLVTLCEDCHELETENYKTAEDLISMVRDKFFTDEICSLTNGFHQLEVLSLSGVVADVYGWALSSPDIQKELTKRYLVIQKEKNG